MTRSTGTRATLPRTLLLAAAVLGVAATALPVRAAEQDGQAWILTTAQGSIGGRWRLYLEAQPRLNGDGAQALLLRPAIGYQLTPTWSLWQGYAWTPTFDPWRNEHRSFQQSVVTTPRGWLPFSLVNRTRFEQRFIEDAATPSLRLRHMLRGELPLDSDGTWALAAYDEVFVVLNDRRNGPQAGFDQNRAFLGVSRALTPNIRLEIGYVNQFIDPSDQMNHIGFTWLDYRW